MVPLVRLDWPWLVKMVECLAVLIYNIAEYFGWLGFLTTCSILRPKVCSYPCIAFAQSMYV